MKKSLLLMTGLGGAFVLQLFSLPVRAEQNRPLNVLFLCADDLRPSLGCYGDPIAITPHIDQLAKTGLVFNRAYCQQAVCSPSRTSLMTGLRPDTTKVFDLQKDFRDTVPSVVTLPQLFRNHGYHSQAVGKIYHSVKSYSLGDGALDDEQSWSIPGWLPQLHYYHTPEGIRIAEKWFKSHRNHLLKRYPHLQSQTWKDAVIRGLPRESPDVPDESLSDAQIATRAIEIMNQRKNEPFFLAVGFLKPHVPFVAPQRYFDLYPLEKIRNVSNPYFPQGAPAFAGNDSQEMRVYHGIPPKGPVAEGDEARELYRAYYACVSFIDAQVGRLLDELDRLKLRDNTVIVFWSDHGYHLRENGIWCKQTNFELSNRVPLIISSPTQKIRGAKTNALVELVDIYPTLADLCELPVPKNLEGLSFEPLMNDPDRPWKTAAFSLYPRNVPGKGRIMGRSMKVEQYRFTEWTNSKGSFREVELYDHQNDPEENQNVANRSENSELLKKLTKKLHAGWQAALPQDASDKTRKNTEK